MSSAFSRMPLPMILLAYVSIGHQSKRTTTSPNHDARRQKRIPLVVRGLDSYLLKRWKDAFISLEGKWPKTSIVLSFHGLKIFSKSTGSSAIQTKKNIVIFRNIWCMRHGSNPWAPKSSSQCVSEILCDSTTF